MNIQSKRKFPSYFSPNFISELITQLNWLNNTIFAVAELCKWHHTCVSGGMRGRDSVGAERGWVPFAMTKWSRQNCRVQPGGDNSASNERNHRITPRTIIEFRRAVVKRRVFVSLLSLSAHRITLETHGNYFLNAYVNEISPARLDTAYSYWDRIIAIELLSGAILGNSWK